jgi:glycosyltransferase involved in cell wall biosynthesis
MENGKYKILMLSDHALSTSGVGCQTRFLVEGLLKKGCWTVRQLGAAMKHSNYDVIKVNPDFIIKPIDGFGDRETLIHALVTEKPDVVFIFTDPRFFIWLYQMEDEIREMCPLVYWHVWDNCPYPKFNDPLYEATDLINCHSYLTYELIKEKYPEKTNFVPHTIPEELFFPLKQEEIRKYREMTLGKNNVDAFILLWVNRNARRKRPSDVVWAWSIFVERWKKEGSIGKKPILMMHTDPHDPEGPNLIEVVNYYNVKDSVVFSNQRVDFEKMNVIHNISDACINISYAEGFGLSTLESMNCAKPIIATKTGGLTRQVEDHRDGSHNGIALEVDYKTCVGSQNVPYIHEDHVDVNNVAEAIYRMYSMEDDERKNLGLKAREYALNEFSYQNTIDKWHETMINIIEKWKSQKPKRWSIKEMNP